MMSRSLALMLLILLTGAVTGCAAVPGYGLLYTDAVLPGPSGNNPIGVRTGQSCVTTILFFSMGDVGKPPLATAAKNGNINEIGTVNYAYTSVLSGFYSKGCTVVTGN
jgi:hypothetical protein